MFERPFHNPAYNDYEVPVKTHADEGDGYEELPVDKEDGNAMQYLFIYKRITVWKFVSLNNSLKI